jgi:HD-like signal output (HDOD) protein
VDLSEVAALFHSDPALTARAVAVCNSPYYSRGETITDIRDAIIHLGLNEVSRIVHSVILTDFKKYPTHLYTNVADHFWERSLHTAVVVDELSGGNPAAYTAGIMHLVGVWILSSIFPVGFLSIAERELDLQAQLEQHRLGVNFARAGGRAMVAWGFEPAVCGAVLWQLAPSASEDPAERELAKLLNRAVSVADWHYGVRNEHTLLRSDLTINDLEECNQRALEKVARVGLGG